MRTKLTVHTTTSVIATVALLLLPACSSTPKSLVTTIDDLTSDTDREGKYSVGQNRIVSLSGTLSASAPGQVFRYKSNRAPSTMFGLTPGDSYLDVLTIQPPPGEDPAVLVLQVKQAIREAQVAAAEMVASRMRLSAGERKLRAPETNADPGLVSQIQGDLRTSRTQFAKAKSNLATKAAAASRLVNDPGVIVFRWATESKSSFSLSALLNFERDTDTASSGYTIAAGWRESTLILGPDVQKVDLATGERWDWFVLLKGWFPWFGANREDKYRRLTTRTVQAKAMAYLQDISIVDSLEADLEITVETLGSTARALNAIEKIELKAALAQVKSLSTEGLFARACRTVVPNALEQLKPDVNGTFPAPHVSNDGWLTFLTVEADLPDLKKLFE